MAARTDWTREKGITEMATKYSKGERVESASRRGEFGTVEHDQARQFSDVMVRWDDGSTYRCPASSLLRVTSELGSVQSVLAVDVEEGMVLVRKGPSSAEVETAERTGTMGVTITFTNGEEWSGHETTQLERVLTKPASELQHGERVVVDGKVETVAYVHDWSDSPFKDTAEQCGVVFKRDRGEVEQAFDRNHIFAIVA